MCNKENYKVAAYMKLNFGTNDLSKVEKDVKFFRDGFKRYLKMNMELDTVEFYIDNIDSNCAFEKMINKTSNKRCPWYVVPADKKWYARLIVSRIVLATLKEIDPQFPVVTDEGMDRIQGYKDSLLNSLTANKDKKEKEYDKLDENTKKEMESVFVDASQITRSDIEQEEMEKASH